MWSCAALGQWVHVFYTESALHNGFPSQRSTASKHTGESCKILSSTPPQPAWFSKFIIKPCVLLIGQKLSQKSGSTLLLWVSQVVTDGLHTRVISTFWWYWHKHVSGSTSNSRCRRDPSHVLIHPFSTPRIPVCWPNQSKDHSWVQVGIHMSP